MNLEIVISNEKNPCTEIQVFYDISQSNDSKGDCLEVE